MKRWHLYLDESGTFNALKDDGKTAEYNLVGGFMLPENGVRVESHKPLVNDWVNEVVDEARETFQDAGDYDFKHCCENKGKWADRKRIQPFLLERYRQRILDQQGRIIIFDGGRNLEDVDNTSTFLSVLSKGIIRLYHALEAEEPDNEVELIAHCARRTPHGNERTTPIQKEEYQREMKHIAFLLCEYPHRPDDQNPFYRTVDTIDIMPNWENHVENPLTSVCDCLCNTYQHVQLYGVKDSGWGKVYKATYGTKRCMIFDTTQSANIEEGDMKRMEHNRAYVPMLIRLLNRKNPDPTLVKAYFDRLNGAMEFEQRSFVKELVERLNVETQSYYRNVFADVARQIERIIEMVDEHMTNRILVTELLANAYLFLLTMDTHRGDDAAALDHMEDFRRTVADVQDHETAGKLWEIYHNRLLVFQTDRFEFAEVEEGFARLTKYWKNQFDRDLIFGMTQSTSVQYGREIGSYLQMMRFKLRHSKLNGGKDFDILRDLAREYAAEGERHLRGDDLSRLHQTMCDVEAEIGDYKVAFEHLYAAAMLRKRDGRRLVCAAPFHGQAINAILGVAWSDHMEDPFIYYRLVRLMNELAIIGDRRASSILERFRGCVPATFESTKADDMRIDIKWKLGSTHVRIGNADKGKMFLNDALKDALDRHERVFDAIAIAIACERAALGVSDGQEVPGMYEEFLRKTEEAKAQDLFDGVLPKDGTALKKGVLIRASRMIAY